MTGKRNVNSTLSPKAFCKRGGYLCRFDSIHFPKVQFIRMNSFEIGAGMPIEDLTILYLGLIGFPLFELHFPFQIYIPAEKDSFVNVGIEGCHG